MRILLRDQNGETCLIDSAYVFIDHGTPGDEPLGKYMPSVSVPRPNVVLRIKTARPINSFVILPETVAESYMEYLLKNDYLDLSMYMDQTFIYPLNKELGRLYKVLGLDMPWKNTKPIPYP